MERRSISGSNNITLPLSLLFVCVFLMLSGCGGSSGGSSNDSSPHSVVLSWVAPATYADGGDMANNLKGYKLHYGTEEKRYTMVLDVGKVTQYEVKGLSSGKYFFAVTAYDIAGIESAYSNEVMREL